jgi:protoheme IX farnesyltransferase
MLRAYLVLTKSGIIVFTIISALAGYGVSFDPYASFDPLTPLFLIIGLYFVSAGSFAINQAQEWKIDARMNRTKKRPIPQKIFKPWQAYTLGFIWVALGLVILYPLGKEVALLALATMILYNGVYTLFWKRRWAFGAVPGAIPGAMPVLIGYAVNEGPLWSAESLYLFLVMFLWQMPHFWSLAIRYKEDYQQGGIPVLPSRLGVDRTLYHMGLYLLTYVGVALSAPWFLHVNLLYVFLVLPISLKLVWEFFKYFSSGAKSSWLPFFLWINFSLLVYLLVPVVDKWLYFFMTGKV